MSSRLRAVTSHCKATPSGCAQQSTNQQSTVDWYALVISLVLVLISTIVGIHVVRIIGIVAEVLERGSEYGLHVWPHFVW